MILVAVDPGQEGGLAVLDKYEGTTNAWAFPDSEYGVWELFAKVARLQGDKRALLELAAARPMQNCKATFSQGRNYGFVRACLVATQIPFEEIRAQDWERELGCLSKKGETYGEHKKALCVKARQLYPAVDVTLKTCDALLMLEWLRRRENGVAK